MAIRVDEAQAMIEAAARAGVVLQVGHSHSYDLPIARMREIVASGALGRARMIHTWNFTDWMARPRRPAELDVGQGGGVTYRQGAHQIDILRLIGGGLVKSVRATTFDWDESRRSIGAQRHLSEFCRRHGRDRRLQRLRPFRRHRADRRHRRVGRGCASAH